MAATPMRPARSLASVAVATPKWLSQSSSVAESAPHSLDTTSNTTLTPSILLATNATGSLKALLLRDALMFFGLTVVRAARTPRHVGIAMCRLVNRSAPSATSAGSGSLRSEARIAMPREHKSRRDVLDAIRTIPSVADLLATHDGHFDHEL